MTVVVFISLVYYFLIILKVENIFVLSIIGLCFIILSAIFISKLAVDPLLEYVKDLQNLSKETLHELNLPISTIKTNIGMLYKSTDDAKSMKRLNRINAACDMLQERYNELDYLIKMQSADVKKEDFFLDELVEQRVAFLQQLYPSYTFNLSLERVEVLSDKKGLEKVVDNLIDNGVKYSQDSKLLDISTRNETLIIEDYGIGMDEVQLLHIFDNYYQQNSSVQGFGIGLSMVKRFCDANSIELKFHSSLGVGTKIELQFKSEKGR